MLDQISGVIKDLEKRYGIKERTARHLVATKEIIFIKIGRLVRFKFADIDQWLSDNTTKRQQQIKSTPIQVRRSTIHKGHNVFADNLTAQHRQGILAGVYFCSCI